MTADRRIVIGADDDHSLVDAAERVASQLGLVVTRLDATAWPEAGRAVGEVVALGNADLGIAVCWTGTGVTIAANKVPGVRAALCLDAYTATGARRWNDANVLTLSMRSTSIEMATEIITAFVETCVDENELDNINRLG